MPSYIEIYWKKWRFGQVLRIPHRTTVRLRKIELLSSLEVEVELSWRNNSSAQLKPTNNTLRCCDRVCVGSKTCRAEHGRPPADGDWCAPPWWSSQPHTTGHHRIWSASMVFLTFSILQLKNRFLVDMNSPVLKASGVRKSSHRLSTRRKNLQKRVVAINRMSPPITTTTTRGL